MYNYVNQVFKCVHYIVQITVVLVKKIRIKMYTAKMAAKDRVKD